MTTYIKHWADVIGTAYTGLSQKEKMALEEVENDIIKLYTGARGRLDTWDFDKVYTIEVNHIEGYFDGLEDLNDVLEGIVSTDYYNTMEGLISLWDEFFTTMLNEATEG